MRARSAPFYTFVLRLLVAVVALAVTVGPWGALVRPVAAAGNPDLTIESITTNPADPSAGDTVIVTIRVKNIGSAMADGCYVTGEVDEAVITNQAIIQLPPNMTATASFPWAATPGVHVIRGTVDSTGIVYESDETNNVSSYTLTPRAADLTITSITWSPEAPALRQEVQFAIHVRNVGTAYSKATRVNFLVDSKSRGYQDVPVLNPGDEANIVYSWIAAPGVYLMTARVDEDGMVPESDESNNEKSLTFTTALPDVTVNAIYQDPAEFSTGDDVSLTAEITNRGTGQAATSDVAFYINDVLFTTLTCPPLAAGASANVSTTWTARDGDNVLRVVADVNDILPETDEANNTATWQMGAVPPDLTVSDITWTPESVGAGDSVSIEITVKNVGSGRAETSRAIFQIGLAASQIYIIPPIEAGNSYTLTVPWQAIAGKYQVYFTANYDSSIYETKYSNNNKTADITVAPPDLTVSNITWTPQHPDHGTPVSFNVTVTNQGKGTADQSYLGYYIDDQLVNNTLVRSLNKGESVNMTFSWTAVNGYHTFSAMADFKKQIPEADETNNTRSVAVVANMPDLVIDSVTWSPPDLPVGQDATFTLKIHNIGTQPVPLTRLAYYVDDVMAGYVDVPPLAADGVVNQSLTWPISSGEHVIEFVTDSTDLVEEIDEENNTKILTLPLPDLVVTDLSPSPAAPVIGDTVTLTVTLTNEGQSTTQATVLSGRLDEETTQTLPVAPLAPGATVSKTYQWQATGGTHTFSVAADVTNTTIESDETNNYRSVEVTTRTPDLTVGELGWSMPNPLVNDTVDLSANITNIGDDTALPSKLVYQIDDGEPLTGDVPELAAGESFAFTATEDLDPKPHTFSITLDPEDALWETDETNNSANLTFNSKAPDLDIRAISWTPVEAAVGDNVTISVNLENRGNAIVDGVTVRLSIDGEVVATQTADDIGIGESQTLKFSWTLTSLAPVITAMADYGGQITESDETNNSLTREAAFTAPTPTPTRTLTLPELNEAPQNSFIQSYWWAMMIAAGLIGAGVFFVLLRAFRKE